MIGLRRDEVILFPHNSKWKDIFLKEKINLENSIGTYIISIEHVGSTSIPDIPAKPIIDIAVAVNNFEEAKVCIFPLEKLGYEYKGEFGIPRRHYFIKGDPVIFHLHMNEINSDDWNNQINFRNFLQKNEMIAQEYAEIKLKLAQKFPKNREAYLTGKGFFIEKILKIIEKG